MEERLEKARDLLKSRPALADLEVYAEAGELHLVREGESFIRLIPARERGRWRMEYFRNLKEWEVIDFMGTLEECLDYLVDYPHFRFWEG